MEIKQIIGMYVAPLLLANAVCVCVCVCVCVHVRVYVHVYVHVCMDSKCCSLSDNHYLC